VNKLFFSLFIFACAAQSESVTGDPHAFSETQGFSDYPAAVFSGKHNIPDEFKIDSDGLWRDSAGKEIDIPKVNFAGKYFLSTHSCGANCRYYQLTDLSTGIAIPVMDMFTSADPPPRTRDGYHYITILFYRPDSNMLVAQYEIQKNETLECRERLFTLDNEQLLPITKKRDFCNEWKN
jgi:hypothetical protein